MFCARCFFTKRSSVLYGVLGEEVWVLLHHVHCHSPESNPTVVPVGVHKRLDFPTKNVHGSSRHVRRGRVGCTRDGNQPHLTTPTQNPASKRLREHRKTLGDGEANDDEERRSDRLSLSFHRSGSPSSLRRTYLRSECHQFSSDARKRETMTAESSERRRLCVLYMNHQATAGSRRYLGISLILHK